MEEQQLEADVGRISVNAEFYRKLTQQIVQKDNIIKLLRLQVENLRGAGDEGEGAGEATEELRRENDELRRRLEAAGRSSRGDERSAAAEAEERRELEARIERLQDELLTARTAGRGGNERVAELERRVGELVEERTDLSRRLVELTDELASSGADVAAEVETRLAAVQAALDEARSEAKRLHRRLEEARAETRVATDERDQAQADAAAAAQRTNELERLAASLPDAERLQDERDRAMAQVTLSEGREAALRQELAAATAALRDLRAEALRKLDRGDLRLLTGLVEIHEELLARCEGQLPSEVASAVEAVFDALALRRIETVGRRMDPGVHRAVETVYSTAHPDGTVVAERSAGYRAAGAVLKPADVVLSRDPYWCSSCARSAGEGSRFCNGCGGRLLAQELPAGAAVEGPRAGDLVALAEAREAEGDTEGARGFYERALTVEPRERRALRGLARLLESAGAWAQARERYEELAATGTLTAAEERGRRRLALKLEILDRVRDIF